MYLSACQCAALATVLFATPVMAEQVQGNISPDFGPAAVASAPKPARNIYNGNFLIIGLGVANMPTFEGSRSTGIFPAAGIMGRYHGININPRTAGIAIDLIKDPADSRIGFSLGPVIRWRAGRSANLKDVVVASLGRVKGNVELGVTAGIQLKHITNNYDSLSFGVDVRWDATGKSGSRVISFGPSYFTPVSKAQIIGISASVDFVNHKYSNLNYGVTTVGSTASGLPVFAGRAGMKSVGLKAFTAYDLSGDLRDGGFSIGLGVGYTMLAGSAAQSPIVALRGRRNRFNFAAGVAYAF
jgi:outer membrane scaffolding protein for murein synthesis (MipA/OmpV family)